MKVLVDTSVWSLALRVRSGGSDSAAVTRLRALIDRGDVVLSGLILQEVLQGFRDEAHFRKARQALAAFPLLQLNRAHYLAAAVLRRTCAANGVAASTTDCQIAAAAIAHRCGLLTNDVDFVHIADLSPLKLDLDPQRA